MTTRLPKEAKDPKDRRTNAYTVRYSDGEDALINAAAEDAALEVGSWIRMVSVRAAREPTVAERLLDARDVERERSAQRADKLRKGPRG